jgi:mannan endo-1,4-beta-mannosidase
MDDFAVRYMEWYPGDAYVDVLGLDEYFWPPRAGTQDDPAARLAEHLRHVVTEADARGKVAALTETGFETIPDSAWWTGTLLRAIQGDPAARRIAWVLVWRNAYRPGRSSDHFYAPYPGHASAPDFIRFTRDPLIWLEDDLPDLYGRGRR